MFGAEPIGKLFVSIGANVDSFNRAMGHVDRGMQQAARTATRTTTAMAATERQALSLGKAFAFLGGMAAAMAIVRIGQDMIRMAMDAVESENLFSVSMGNMADSARAWSDEISRALGLNQYAVREMLATFNVMFDSMGMGTQAAFDMSKGLTQLAYDMASFYNLKPDEAFLKLQAAIAGETEPLRRLGIDISDAKVEAWALTNGLIKQGQELTQAAKTAIRYNLIIEQTNKAQGDMARTMDSPANQLRRLQAEWEMLSIAIGQVFLPVVGTALGWLNDEGLPRVQAGVEALTEAWSGMSKQGESTGKLIAAVTTNFIFNPIGVTWKLLKQGVPLFQAIQQAGLMAFKTIGAAVVPVADVVYGFLAAIGEGLSKIGEGMVELSGKIPRLPGLSTLADGMRAVGADIARMGSSLQDARAPIDDVGARLSQLGSDASDAFGAILGDLDELIEGGLEGLIGKYDEAVGYTNAYKDANEQMRKKLIETKLPMIDVADAVKNVGVAAQGAGTQAKMAIGQIVDALVAVHPAAIAAAAAVAAIGQRIADVNLALIANRDQLRAAQDEYSKMGDRLADLNQQLSEAQARLDKLAQPKLKGMGEMETQMRWVQDQLNRMKLARTMRLPMSEIEKMFPAMSEAQKTFLATLPKTEGALERFLEMLRLQYGLKFDEQLALIGEAAGEAEEELSFEDAIKAIGATKEEIAKLTGAVDAQKAAMAAQKQLVDSLQRAMESLNTVLDTLQNQLREAERRQKLVNDALELAFKWFLEDRKKIAEMGSEAATQAGVVDDAVRSLLDALGLYVDDSTGKAIGAIDAVERAYAEAIARINQMLAGLSSAPAPPPVPSGAGGTPAGGGGSGSGIGLPPPPIGVQSTGGGVVVQFTGPVYANDPQQVEVMAYRVAQKIQERRR